LSLPLMQVWNWWGPGEIWLKSYVLVTYLIMFGLLGWLVYDGLNSTVRRNRLNRQQLNIDIFDTEKLAPFARSSLSASLAFIGGISLSIPCQPVESLIEWENIVVYAVLFVVAILLFFYL
jgi:hypothetical protein